MSALLLPLKWPGNKYSFASRLAKHAGLVPLKRDSVRWISLFGGGLGEVFGLMDAGWLRVGDTVECYEVNKTLLGFWSVLRDFPTALKLALDKLPCREGWQSTYRGLREEFNALNHGADPIRHAALFCWLTRACLNGLWRENGKGQMNQSVGSYATISLPSGALLSRRSRQLRHVTISSGGWHAFRKWVDFDFWRGLRVVLYADPPYRPLSKTSCFTAYGPNPFGDEDFEELRESIEGWAKRANVMVMLSEQSRRAVKGFSKGFRRCSVSTTRKASAQPKGRKVRFKEVLLVSQRPHNQGPPSCGVAA